jgi:hypothetical protein
LFVSLNIVKGIVVAIQKVIRPVKGTVEGTIVGMVEGTVVGMVERAPSCLAKLD